MSAVNLERQLNRIEAKLDELLGQRREASDISVDLCLAADDPIAALRERNKRIVKRRGKGGASR